MIYLDYPSFDCTWTNIRNFKTRAEAVAWLREMWGEHAIKDDGSVILISGTDEPEGDKENA